MVLSGIFADYNLLLHCFFPCYILFLKACLKKEKQNLLYKNFHDFLCLKYLCNTSFSSLALNYKVPISFIPYQTMISTVLVSLSMHIFFMHKRISSTYCTNKLIASVYCTKLQRALISQHFLLVIIHSAASEQLVKKKEKPMN